MELGDNGDGGKQKMVEIGEMGKTKMGENGKGEWNHMEMEQNRNWAKWKLGEMTIGGNDNWGKW